MLENSLTSLLFQTEKFETVWLGSFEDQNLLQDHFKSKYKFRQSAAHGNKGQTFRLILTIQFILKLTKQFSTSMCPTQAKLTSI